MSAGSTAKLYTADILGLATELAEYPLLEALSMRAEARSRTCGSSLVLGLDVQDDGAITQLGIQVSACAIGQAAAAIFARDANGRTLGDIERAKVAIEEWLAAPRQTPAWAGIEALEEARAYTARHGAILLPWNAAIEALSKH